MKISDIIKTLQEEIQMSGDVPVLAFRVETATEITERRMMSKTRKGKNGYPLKMTPKEFRDHLVKQGRES